MLDLALPASCPMLPSPPCLACFAVCRTFAASCLSSMTVRRCIAWSRWVGGWGGGRADGCMSVLQTGQPGVWLVGWQAEGCAVQAAMAMPTLAVLANPCASGRTWGIGSVLQMFALRSHLFCFGLFVGIGLDHFLRP